MKETTICYIEHEGKVLLLHRMKKKEDPNAGKWIGVGGKLEQGETVEECLLREVKEETGLVLTEYEYRGSILFQSDCWEHERMHLYYATAFTGTLIDCDEGQLAWVPREQMLSLPTWEGDRIFLRRMLRDSSFFRLRLRYVGEKLVHTDLAETRGTYIRKL